jgi:lipoprotein-anchoring transpeptidase ErfK/SrfK
MVASGHGHPAAVAGPAPVARIRQAVVVTSRPGGSVVTTLGARTPYGSPQTAAVVARRGGWLEVQSPELGNGRVGWIRASQVSVSATGFALRADLSQRTLQVRLAGRVVRRFPIAVGAAATPTPTGRFFVTDKLPGPRYGSVFGCCILAISAIQPKSVTGWRTDGRVAIHGLVSTRQLGTGASYGCMLARQADLQWMMRRLPLGTPVIITR